MGFMYIQGASAQVMDVVNDIIRDPSSYIVMVGLLL
jgi:hypothetical protein